MKTYRNKLYSMPDAARRAGIEENQLRTLISVNAVKYERQFGIYYINGGEVPNIKNKWEWFMREDKPTKSEILYEGRDYEGGNDKDKQEEED